ncbi:phosphoesterase PA-phosphatase [Thiocystis violacea]|nr:phosphoesterase PA-phosphatase [Thiocystis violacea]
MGNSERAGRLSEAASDLVVRIRRCDFRRAWGERLTAGAVRTPLDAPGGDRWLLSWVLVGAIVGASLFLVCGYHAGFLRLNALAAEVPGWIWPYLTVLGDERVAFALTLFFSLRYPRLFWTLILAAVIAIAMGRGLKLLFDAARPPAVLAADLFNLIGPSHQRASFPSGHSLTAAVFLGVLIHQARWVGWRALLTLLAVLVGLSRVAVGVHWPVDVAAGLTIGALAAWIGGRLAARWPGPATHVGVHMGFVLLASLMALGLIFDDGGYSEAASALRLLGLAAIGSAIGHYVLPPLKAARLGG